MVASTHSLPFLVKKQIGDPGDGEVKWLEYPLCLPHDWMRFLWESHREQFMTDFVGGTGDLESFWRGVEMTDHRLRAARTGNYMKELIPLVLHGDGVHVGGTYSDSNYNNASMEGLLTTHASGGSMERCYLLAGYPLVHASC